MSRDGVPMELMTTVTESPNIAHNLSWFGSESYNAVMYYHIKKLLLELLPRSRESSSCVEEEYLQSLELMERE